MALRKHSVDLALSLTVLTWGVSPSLFKFALEEMDPFAFTYVRFLFITALAVFILWLRGRRRGHTRRVERRDVLPLIISGLSGYSIYQLFYIVGLNLTTVFGSALLVATVPLFSAILLALFRTERVSLLQWLGILLAFVGVALFLFAAGGQTQHAGADSHVTPSTMIIGDVLSLGAALSFALYGITNKKLGARYSPAELMCYTLIIGTLALSPIGVPALFHQNWALVTWRAWAVMGYAVVFPIYISYTIWNWAIMQRGVGYVTLYNYLTPILGGIGSFLILGEQFSAGQLVGAAVVLSGLLLARRGVTSRAKKEAAEAAAADNALGTAAAGAPVLLAAGPEGGALAERDKKADGQQ
ncbi:MAG TPA: DMT family transporter [Ktedonobacterales bacterium]|nr:DMT family transporter [Ktedonobacterales bacterium]